MTRILMIAMALMVSAQTTLAQITYQVNRAVGSGTIVGDITTDGTIGTIGTGNIIDYNLTITDASINGGTPVTLNPANETQFFVQGNAMNATASVLTFDTSRATDDLVIFQGGVSNEFYCLETATGNCSGAGIGEHIGFPITSNSTNGVIVVGRTPITYVINREVGDGAVCGTITTDGTLGVLTTSNIIDWDLDLYAPGMADGPVDSIDFPTSFQTIISGTGTIATPTELRFDFGASGFFLMQGFTAMGETFGNFYCIEVSGCTSGGTGEHIGQADDGGNVAQTTPGSGVVTFATVAGPDPITYTINREVASGRVWGTITTDGKFGVMRSSNIIAWDLTLCAPNLESGPETRITSDSQIQTNLNGNTTIASSTDLMFDISQGDLGEGFFLLQGTAGTFGNFYCIETSGCTGQGLGEHIGYEENLNTVAQTGFPSGMFSFATTNPDDITYQIDRTIGNGSVTGWITLDGSMNTLVTDTNIVDFELTVSGPNLSGGPVQVFTPATVSQARFDGAVARATPTQILFDISGGSGEGFFVTQSSSTGDYWCVETEFGNCTGLGEGEYIGFDIGGSTASEMASPSGTFAFAEVTPTITYQVNRRIGAGTVTGFITTDGTLGVIDDVNIIDWELTLTAPNLLGGGMDTIDIATGIQTNLTLGQTVATSTGIFFDNTGSSGEGFFLLQGAFPNTNYWCIETSAGGCTGFFGEHIGRDAGTNSNTETELLAGNIRIATNCPADLNGDGDLDFFDVSAFLQALTNNNPVADFTGDGMYDFFDVSAFLQQLQAGCPEDPC